MHLSLMQDPVTHVGRMAEFLKVPYTKDFIKEVALKCDIDHLKANQIDESRMVHPNHESTMFRKGMPMFTLNHSLYRRI
jgi:hypothetical protein